MNKLFFIIPCLLLLTGCPKEKEVKDMESEIYELKRAAVDVIQNKDFSLDGLLKAHDYFFNFSEKVHLLIVEPDAAKQIRSLIKKKGNAGFCSSFVMPTSTWMELDTYCSSGAFYKCSPEIKEYGNTLIKLKEILGDVDCQNTHP